MSVKKVVIALGLFVFLLGGIFAMECEITEKDCEDLGEIKEYVEVMRLSSVSNGHAEYTYNTCNDLKNEESCSAIDEKYNCVWSGFLFFPKKCRTKPGYIPILNDYSHKLCCYSEKSNTRICNGNNRLLSLSNYTNAHVSFDKVNSYNVDVCFGVGQKCALFKEDRDHPNDEIKVIEMSSSTNAHVGDYGEKYKLYCKEYESSEVGPCFNPKTRDGCWDVTSENCTWTPSLSYSPMMAERDRGNCCPEGKRWNEEYGECRETEEELCNPIWSPENQGSVSERDGVKYYCAKFSNDIDYGILTPVTIY